MGIVYTEITLRNAVDIGNVKSGILAEHEIRQATVQALADTGAYMLVINETMREKLGLNIQGKAPATLANGISANYDYAGPVEVIWKNRKINCDALILPDAKETLLGAIPLEALDLMVNPNAQEVVGVHGDQIMYRV